MATVVAPTVLVEPEKTEETAAIEGETACRGKQLKVRLKVWLEPEEGKDKTTKTSDDKNKSEKPSDDKPKSASTEKGKTASKEPKEKII